MDRTRSCPEKLWNMLRNIRVELNLRETNMSQKNRVRHQTLYLKVERPVLERYHLSTNPSTAPWAEQPSTPLLRKLWPSKMTSSREPSSSGSRNWKSISSHLWPRSKGLLAKRCTASCTKSMLTENRARRVGEKVSHTTSRFTTACRSARSHQRVQLWTTRTPPRASTSSK